MEARRLLFVLGGTAVITLLVIVVLAMAVSGGGDDDDDVALDGPDLPDRVEGELRMFGPDPITLDPHCATDAGSAEYIVEVFSGLVSFDLELNVIPDIAESWEISDDGLAYTFSLRNNVMFHDQSRRVTAQDFKYSLERALNPDTQSTVGEVYLDDIEGALEFARGEADEVTGVQVLDENTLEITITEPSAVFLEKLTYPTAFVVDQRQVGDATCFAGANWQRRPNATGPFKLAEWDLGRRIVLEANENYYLDPRPSLARVTYVLSGGSPLVMYENDEIDVTGVGINDIERIRDPNEPLHQEFVEAISYSTFYIGFDTEEAPFDDPRVRQALHMAIDKEFLANDLLVGLVEPAHGIVPPGMAGYAPEFEGLPFDPDAARALLEEAGNPDLSRETLMTVGVGATPSVILEAILAMWQQHLGVNMAIEQQDFAFFLTELDRGGFGMYSLGWIADYPDPQNFLEIKLHGDSPNNDNFYRNEEADALMDQARVEADEAERMRLYEQAEAMIVQDSPWIPLYHGKVNALVKPHVEGFQLPPMVIPNLRYVSINR
jgi:oligopeptide transport system substrate-binding protein